MNSGPRRGAATVAVFVAVVFASACSSSTNIGGPGTTKGTTVTAPTTTGGTGTTSRPDRATGTVLDAIDAQIGADGSIPVDAARQLFQVAYGGLSGVSMPAGAAPPPIDGTVALAAMERHRRELSAADRARLDAVVGIGGAVSATVLPGDTVPHGIAAPAGTQPPPVKIPTCPALDPNDEFTGSPLGESNPDVGDFRLRVAHWEQVLDIDAGISLDLPVQIVVFTENNPAAQADTLALDENCQPTGAPVVCRIRFFGNAVGQAELGRDAVVAHELWHCFQFMTVGDGAAFGKVPAWIVEGQASWVEAKETDVQVSFFEAYLKTAELDLFRRAYSAIGFYTTMQTDGADMFTAFKQMLGAANVSSAAAFDVAVNDAPGLLDNWASMFFEAESTAGWHYSPATGGPPPYSPGGQIPDAGDLDVADGVSAPLTVAPHTVGLVRLHQKTDLVHVTASDHASTLDEAGTATAHVTDVWFCAHDDPQQCQCPAGSSGNAPQSTYADGDIFFAQAAGDTAESSQVEGVSLSSLCQPGAKNDDSAFCADAKSLHDITQAYIDSGGADLASQAQADEQWTAKMSADAPGDIATSMAQVAAAFATANRALASVGYQRVGGPDVIKAGQTAIAAIHGVSAQSKQVGDYIGAHCGFAFTFA